MAPARFRQIAARPRNEPGLRGRLEEFGLATVLTFLDLERRSGEVLVATEDKVGRVRVRAGQVISARIEGSRRVNQAAIYELISWDSGWFAFTRGDLDSVTDEIGAPTALLLMNAARRCDEAAAPAC